MQSIHILRHDAHAAGTCGRSKRCMGNVHRRSCRLTSPGFVPPPCPHGIGTKPRHRTDIGRPHTVPLTRCIAVGGNPRWRRYASPSHNQGTACRRQSRPSHGEHGIVHRVSQSRAAVLFILTDRNGGRPWTWFDGALSRHRCLSYRYLRTRLFIIHHIGCSGAPNNRPSAPGSRPRQLRRNGRSSVHQRCAPGHPATVGRHPQQERAPSPARPRAHSASPTAVAS